MHASNGICMKSRQEEIVMPTFDTPKPISITIDIAAGNVHFVASDRTDTTVEVRPGDDTNQADVKAAAQTRVDYLDGAHS